MQNKLAGLLVGSFVFVGTAMSVYAGPSKQDTKKQKVSVPDIPPDMPEYFLQRYDYFIFKKERKAIELVEKQLKELDKKNATDEVKAPLLAERERLIAEFWTKRDPEPSTVQNEFKEVVDERIDDIAGDVFFKSVESAGLSFTNNGGLHGDMAKVYLLHGAPTLRSVWDNPPSAVDLMLWVYMDKDTGNLRYAFLFYKQGGGGAFKLFPQDRFAMESQEYLCMAVNEIMVVHAVAVVGCTQEAMNVLRQLYMGQANDGTPGYYYIWALQHFSANMNFHQGEALLPPLPASEEVKRAPSRVAGQAPELTGVAGTDYVLSSCDACKSMIPGEIDARVPDLKLVVHRNLLDLVKHGDTFEATLSTRVVFEPNESGGKQPLVFEHTIRLTSQVGDVSDSEISISLVYREGDGEYKNIPAGTYRVSIYVKNTLTNKYFATTIDEWVKE